MEPTQVPPPLRERLGDDASFALLEMFHMAGQAWRDEVLTLATERFGRLLAEEMGKLRLDMAQGDAALRQEIVETRGMLGREIAQGDAALRQEIAAVRQDMAQGDAALRQEIVETRAVLRQEIAQGDTALRLELRQGLAAVREEIATTRVELLKWSFLFWIGQVAAMAALLSFMLRNAGAR